VIDSPAHSVASVASEMLPKETAGRANLSSAVRPILLFVTAFALNISPHEAAHALAAYLMGFSSTLFQMWVNPDAAPATPAQLAVIACAGPIFSLIVGIVCWLLYTKAYKTKRAGLFFLMMATMGVYSFLGPLAGIAFGGDFNNAAILFFEASKPVLYLASGVGSALLGAFMFVMGMELSRWGPPAFGRMENAICTTAAPWIIGTALSILVYLPLPRFLIASAISGSSFWAFAVIGAAFGYSRTRTSKAAPPLSLLDLILLGVALTFVRVLAHGIRLSH